MQFSDLPLNKSILKAVAEERFHSPTLVQEKAIPLVLEKKNVIVSAQTGTGKTLAYGLPMIESIMKNDGQGLVVVPTRELADQVGDALRQVGRLWGLKCSIIIGGVSQRKQVKK